MNYALPVSADLGEMALNASVYWQDDMWTSQIASNLDQVAVLQDWSAEDLAIAKDDVNLKAD